MKIKRQSFNPHWINKVHCRDYQIGNVLIRDVPDDYVKRNTKGVSPYGFSEGNIQEFLNSYKINVVLKAESPEQSPKGEC